MRKNVNRAKPQELIIIFVFPLDLRKHEEDDFAGKFSKLGFTVLYCFSGLALISMGISLMQEQLVFKMRWLKAKLGVGEKQAVEKYVLTKHFGVLETPQDLNNRPRTSGYASVNKVGNTSYSINQLRIHYYKLYFILTKLMEF